MRATPVMLFVLLWPFLAVADPGVLPQAGGVARVPALVPDPDYVPKVGDSAVLYSPDAGQIAPDLWCATTSQACKDFIKGLLTDDKNATDTLAAAKSIVHLEPRTEIRVLTRDSFEVDAGDGEKPLPCTCLAVMIASGPSRGKTLYTMDYHVTRLVAARTPRPTGTDGSPGEFPTRKQKAPSPPGDTAPGSVPTPVGVGRELPAAVPPALGATPSSPASVSNRTEPPIELSTPGDPPSAAQGARVPAESGGVLSLDTLVPPRESAPAAAQAQAPVAAPPAIPAAPNGGVISLDSLAPVRPSPPAAPATTASVESKVITLESPGTTPPPTLPPAAPARVEEPARVVPPAAAPTPRPEEVISLDSLTPPASTPPPAAPIPQAPQAIDPGLPAGAVTSPAVSDTTATTAQKPRRTFAAQPSQAAQPRRSPVPADRPAPITPQVDRLVPENAPPPVDAALAPPPLSAAGMLATAVDLEKQGKRLEALARYRALVRSHAGSRQAQWAATRITALTASIDVDAQEARASIVLKRAADLEASGNISLALTYFRQVIKVYPRTPSARTATDRIRALGGDESLGHAR